MSNSGDYPPLQAELAGGKPFEGMQYTRIIGYIFDHPQWGMTLLLATVCQFIPLIGNILLIGYQFEIVERLHRGDDPYPEFDFDKFVPYLARGIWPVLVGLVVGLILVPFVLLAIGAVAIGAQALEGEVDEEAIALMITVPSLCGGMFLGVLMTLIMLPMSLQAGLTQSFGAAFNFRFVKDFVSKVWLEVILGTVFLVLCYFVLLVVGMLLCFIGIYPAVTIFLMAQAHLYYQLYSLYLQRGGEPIPLKTAA